MGSRGGRGGRCMTPPLGGLEGEGEGERDRGHHVDPEDLPRGDRQRQAGEDREQDDTRLATIGGQDEQQRLLDVVEDRAAFAHRAGDGGEVVVRQHQRGGFARRVRAAHAHGDADVGGLQRWRIVHPVAGHGDQLALALQGRDQAQLVFGAGPRDDLGLAQTFAKLIVVELFDFLAGQWLVGIKLQSATDGGRSDGVVAGDHQHQDARSAAFFHRFDGLGAGRVDHPHEAEQGEAGLDVIEVQRGGVDVNSQRARASRRCPSPAAASILRSQCARSRSCPDASRTHRSSTFSGAPLSRMKAWPS